MSTRKPPRLANWLLNRFGCARQNPPLAGDILEEFHNGRSAAWYWRQTLALVLTSLGQKARNSRRRLAGAVLGWAAQAGVAFALWSLHFPPSFQHGTGIGLLPSFLVATALMLALVLNRMAIRELKSRSSDPQGLLMSACEQVANGMVVYCGATRMIGVGRQGFLVIQEIILFNFVIGDLILLPVVLTRLRKP